jgi:tetratricopeptide (TPR) repeat protein
MTKQTGFKNYGQPLGVAIFLACVAFVLYSKSFDYGFMYFDDLLHVVQEPIANGITLEGVRWAFTKFDDPYYMPLTRISWMLDNQLFGMDAKAIRIVNTVLHFLNALMVYFFAWMLTNRTSIGLVAALIFSLHPQHVESVAWISQRKELLASFFGLISLVTYTIHKKSGFDCYKYPESKSRVFYYCCIFAYIATMLAKPTWILMPFILLLIDYLIEDKVRLLDKRRLSLLAPFLILSLIFAAIYLSSSTNDLKIAVSTSLADIDIFQRTLNIPLIYTIYLATFFLPFWSSIYIPYPLDLFPAGYYLASFFILFLISYALYVSRYNMRLLLFTWCWFILTLLPVLGITGAGEAVLIGDRWTYLPHIGMIIGLTWFIADAFRSRPWYWKALPASLICFGFYAISSMTLTNWESDYTYWKKTLERTQSNHFAHYAMSVHYARTGNQRLKELHLRDALKYKYDDPKYLLNLATHLIGHGNRVEAISYLEKLLDNEKTPVGYHSALGLAFLKEGDLSLSRVFLNRAVSTKVVSEDGYTAREMSKLHLLIAQTLADEKGLASIALGDLMPNDTRKRAKACVMYAKELEDLSEFFDLAVISSAVDRACEKLRQGHATRS